MKQKKPTVGFYGVSGCAGCLLTVLYEDCFKELVEMVDIKSFPFIKEETYTGKLDYIFVEGTICFDEDIKVIKELRKRTDNLVALGSCATNGGVPSIKNFIDQEKAMKLVYPTYNHLKAEDPTPLHKHVKIDYFIPQCPPDKEEIKAFVKSIVEKKKFSAYKEPVCVECRARGNLCLLTEKKICLGPITSGGCGALCPSNNTVCYGCRGPSNDANIIAFVDMLKDMGFEEPSIHDKMTTFAGLQFREKTEETSRWLEK